jgi:hypothetical protein
MNRTLKRTLVAAAALAGVVVVVYLILVARAIHVISSGCGMDDGPFHATKINTAIPRDSAAIYEVDDGELLIWNRDTRPPRIGLIEHGRSKWTLEMDVRTETDSGAMLWQVENVTIEKASDPIKLDFTGHWTFGAEHGWMTIDREDASNEFCLSW